MASERYIVLAQELGKRALKPGTPEYRRAERRFDDALAKAQKEAAAANYLATGAPAIAAGAVSTVAAVTGGIAALGSGIGGSGFAAAAAVSAAAGPIGLIASAVLLGTAATIAIVGAARQSRAKALAAANSHGEAGREWGRAYLNYWALSRKNPGKTVRVADTLMDRIDKLEEKPSTRARRKRLVKLRRRASALATVLLESGFDAPLPAADVLNAPEDQRQTALDLDGSRDDVPEKSAGLPKLILGLSLLRLFL